MASKAFRVCKELRQKYWLGKISSQELHDKTTAMIIAQKSFSFKYVSKKNVTERRHKR